MKSVVVSGKNIEKAIEDGLKQLGTTFENVDINVISEGGFLKKAVVEITITEENVVEEVEKTLKEESRTKKPQPAKKAQPLKVEKAAKPVKKEEKAKVEQSEEEAKIERETKKIEQEILEINKQNKNEKTLKDSSVQEEIVKFLEGLVYAYNLVAEVQVQKTSNEYVVTINGNNLGVLIGYHGEALEAVQYLLSNYIHNKAGRHYKIVLDIENYRQKRAEALKTMAENLANKVVETKRSFRLEPMTAYERKVIHSHLQKFENIKTHSEGSEPKRYIVINYLENAEN